MYTRAPAPTGRRRPLALFLLIGFAVYLVLSTLATLWTDYLWFDSVGYSSVWVRNWRMNIALGMLGVAIAFLVFWLTMWVAGRSMQRWSTFEEGDFVSERLRDWVAVKSDRLLLAIPLGLGLLIGLALPTWRDQVFLYMNRQPFFSADAIYGVDLGFYVFELPLLATAVDWFFSLLVMATILAGVWQYLHGGLRFDGRRVTATRNAKVQLSLMMALVALVRAVSYRLDRYEMLISDIGEAGFFGPGYTAVNARLPVITLLSVVALIAAALFVVNIFRPGWTLAGMSIVGWLLVSVSAGTIYPALVQRFDVLPNQLERETPYIANNLAATRSAFMFDQIQTRPFEASPDLTIEDIEANRLTVDNLRVWSTSVLLRTYQNFQELEPYYLIGRVDTDRYLDEGVPRQVMVGVREVDEIALPRDDWQNTHLFYTHGFGAVVNQANAVQSDGQPRFLLRDLPPVTSVPNLELEQPRVYFGETYQPGRPVIVKTGTRPQEIDFPLAGGVQYNEYDGDAGVVLSSFWRRLAFAFRYRDVNLLISGEVRPDSRVLVERNVRHIADSIAPFLVSDGDPYPVILDGEILWVVDMYTVTSNFPYSQPVTIDGLDRLPASSAMPRGANYIRNSVKMVMSAFNGDVTFYVTDLDDPIIRAWNRNYPQMFTPMALMPGQLEEHLRYPQDLFRIQGFHYLEYHVENAEDLFTGNDAWSFPDDPSTAERPPDQRTRADIRGTPASSQVLPYYLLTELPGESELSYLLLQPFNPRTRRNMVSFLVADSTPGRYGRLIDFRMPPGGFVDGVGQVGQRIEQDPDIAQQLSLWDQSGSTVIKGDLLVVPIEESVIYFQPIYLEESGGAFPEFRRVVVVFGERIEWANTMDQALELVFGPGQGPGPIDPGVPGTDLEQLVSEALQAFASAQAALTRGDLADYERWIRTAERKVGEIEALLNSAGAD
jgi:uncharacterized protein